MADRVIHNCRKGSYMLIDATDEEWAIVVSGLKDFADTGNYEAFDKANTLARSLLVVPPLVLQTRIENAVSRVDLRDGHSLVIVS